MINYGNGMIFPDSWAYGPPDPFNGDPLEEPIRRLVADGLSLEDIAIELQTDPRLILESIERAGIGESA